MTCAVNEIEDTPKFDWMVQRRTMCEQGGKVTPPLTAFVQTEPLTLSRICPNR